MHLERFQKVSGHLRLPDFVTRRYKIIKYSLNGPRKWSYQTLWFVQSHLVILRIFYRYVIDVWILIKQFPLKIDVHHVCINLCVHLYLLRIYHLLNLKLMQKLRIEKCLNFFTVINQKIGGRLEKTSIFIL